VEIDAEKRVSGHLRCSNMYDNMH